MRESEIITAQLDIWYGVCNVAIDLFAAEVQAYLMPMLTNTPLPTIEPMPIMVAPTTPTSRFSFPPVTHVLTSFRRSHLAN
jgi:hypothetical protein